MAAAMPATERSRVLLNAGLRAVAQRDLELANMALALLHREGDALDYRELCRAFWREAPAMR